MTTTRETADHAPDSGKMVQTPMHRDAAKATLALSGTADHADHIGDATTMIDHAELARLAEAASETLTGSGWFFLGNDVGSRFINAMSPAVCFDLLSEIAALRGDLTVSRDDLDQLQAHFRQRDREANQAERQRDELLNAWRDDGIDLEDFGRIVARLANHGAAPTPVKKERAWICPQDNTPCPPECDSDDRRHCASVACNEQPE